MNNRLLRDGFILIALITATLFAGNAAFAQVNVNGSLKVVHNGIGIIPSFTLGKPAAIGVVSVSKGPFSYTYVTGLEVETGRLWFVDNWIHGNIPVDDHTSLTLGADWSFFFSPVPATVNGGTGDELVHEATRYVIASAMLTRQLGSSTSVSLSYWYNEGIDDRTVDGHYVQADGTQTVSLGEGFNLSLTPSVFYINFTGNSDGWFISAAATLSKRQVPVALTVQVVQDLQTNIDPAPGFQWGGGLVATF